VFFDLSVEVLVHRFIQIEDASTTVASEVIVRVTSSLEP